ncbi:RNA polymerase sigma factor, sigma-70 family [Amycolatopsis xylanica]|uniref:RNA polymerase sigma factor, sigma-70 family n=1 Tax=Amycolatopsis xylanica TaxID=589385 RepID=A0A1H2SAT1_9PSEU|nr:sigma-70 family RNA polymerase sigma factor [Amycolatopsis xylanica]SDW28712.1 RNA polymerase sigma factor, sigma-70 family [Amycolatopsis xylanica]
MNGRERHAQVDMTQVTAARAGDREAMDALVADHLQLVYSITGHALSSAADVDDVVQETMLRVVRDLDRLRDPDRFRSWLVAVTLNQIRDHYRRNHAAPAPLDEYEERPDPEAEFVEVALSRLQVAEQRREVDEAARWLAPADRELLALWTLERAGHLTRTEVAEALQLEAHVVTVRISRLKTRLEAVRPLVRALAAEPRCPGITQAAEGWSGEPGPLWRKRFLRHLEDCSRCRRGAFDALPIERILIGAALLSVPAGFLPRVLSSLHEPAQLAAGAPLASVSPFRRVANFASAKPALVATGAAVACAIGVAGVLTLTPSSPPPVAQAADAFVAPSVSVTSEPSPEPTVTPSPTETESSESSEPAPSTTTPPSTTKTTPPKPRGSTAAEKVLALINDTRADAGLPALRVDPALVTAAGKHNQEMAGGCGLSHQCPGEPGLGERATAAGAKWSTCGENVGTGGPVADSADAITRMALGLTQSMIDEKPPNDGHRKNILSSSFTRIGIVVTRDARGTVWLTHDFAG